MCSKCSGLGRQYTELFPGAWQVIPCSCAEYNDEELKALWERLEKIRGEKKRGNERKNDHIQHGEVLLTP